MNKYIINNKEGEILSKITLFIKRPINKRETVQGILNKIPYDKSIGYAGYKDRKGLKKFLLWSIFGDKYEKLWNEIKEDEIIEIVNNTINLCSSVINNPIEIFLFPTVNNFVIKKMNGVSGFSPWKNTILINIFPVNDWEEPLKETVAHELAHAIILNFNPRINIQDDLVHEGLAEHFRENFIGGKKSAWVNSISENEAKKILKELKIYLNTQNEELFRQLFFGTDKYPLWAGYSIGYYIVRSYIQKQKNIDWNDLLKTSSQDIIKSNDFLD